MVPQAPFEIVNPPLSQSIHTRKSIKLQDFVYSCYSSSFTSFLASIYCLSKLSSYKEAILDLIWYQAINEEFSSLYKTVLGIWFLYLLVRVLLGV